MLFWSPTSFDEQVERVQVLALHSVLHQDAEAHLRKIFRWYSTTFNTPLMQVYDLPLDFVLTHYYEDKYDAMSEVEVQEVLEFLLADPKERAERVKAKDSAQYEDEKFAKQVEMEEAAKAQEKEKVEEIPILPPLQPPPTPFPDLEIKFEDDNLWRKWEDEDSLKE